MQLRILAVEGDLQSLEAFRTSVEPLGYDVVALADIREAARRIAKEKFDLVALSADMPRGEGFDLARRVRESASNRGVPILMFTAADSGEAMRQGFAVGVTFYMEKPLVPEKLRGLFAAARGVMIQQRRRYVRLPVRVPVECDGAGARFRTESLDLAQGGVLLESSAGLSVGETVRVKFSLPGVREALTLTGRVVRRVVHGGAAIEFIEPERMERAALQLFVTDKTRS